MNSQLPKGDFSHSLGVACRPTLVFVVAFALNVTPHEIVHAITGYLLGFNSTVFQMWVNPDAAEAARWQAVLIAGSGPFFSLTVGAVSWLIYKRAFTERPAGLGFLMMSIVGIYSFLGPLAGTALGGDFHIVFTFLNVAATFGYLTSAFGFDLHVLQRKRTISVGTERIRSRHSHRMCDCCAVGGWNCDPLACLLAVAAILDRANGCRVSVLGACRFGSCAKFLI